MLRRILYAVMVCLVGAGAAFAQSGSLTGTVTDAETGETLPGANVLLVELTRGTTTNLDGFYSIEEVPVGVYTLRVTFVGYAPFEEQVVIESGQTLVKDAVLTPDFLGLDEVVVTGYQTTSKENSNISTQTVSSDDIANRPSVSVTQALTGQVAGLDITTNSGQPGGNSVINLRGVSSINGNTEPLFIMDGMPIDEDNFRSLNPDEIASVTVLKDAGATAIYGNRGANGVVVIETKKGSYNSGFQVDYSGRMDVSSLQDYDYNLMNAQEQLRLEREVGVGRGAGMSDEEIANAPNTDWVDFFFDPAISNSHSLTISHGQENMRNSTILGYTNRDGALAGSSLERYNLRNNLSGRSENGRFNYAVNTSVNYSNNEEPSSIGTGSVNQNIALGAISSVPYISPDEYIDGASIGTATFDKTPLFIMDKLRTFTRTEDEVKLIGSVDASYEILTGLVANATLGADYTEEELLMTQSPEAFNSLLFAQSGNTTPGFSEETSTETISYNVTASLNYETELKDVHAINAGAYIETFQAQYDWGGYRAEGLDPKTFNPGDGAGYVSDNADNDWFSNSAFATYREAGLLSYFGTLGYGYDTRYGVDLTLRRDASYRFIDSNKWGTFYSVSARWNIHNESFLENSIFDILKLRGSYGKTGNQRIVDANGQEAYFSAPDLTLDLYATGVGYRGQNSIFLNQIGNPALRWENVYQSNIGLDVEIFESRLRGSFDVYVKRTTDLSQNRPVSAINSVTQQRANIGELENRGIDWQLEYDVIRSRAGLNLTIGTVGNYNVQEVLEIPTPENEVINGMTGMREGGIINEYYVIRYAGVNSENGELLFLTADGELTEDPNEDTDRVWLGENIYPDVQGSFNINTDYKGLFLDMQWEYTLGVKRFDFDYSGYVSLNNIGAFRSSRDILDSWAEDNKDASLPALDASNRSVTSDRFLRDSDYLRLRHISLGYNIPVRYSEAIGLRGASVFVNAENLVTFTEWRGFDPETLEPTGQWMYPSPRVVSVGLEIQL